MPAPYTPPPQTYERDQSLDVARGMMMLYIVSFIHGIFWLDIFDAHLRTVFLFEMPVIFVISGYSYAMLERKGAVALRWREYGAFLVQRFSRILLPYFAYAAVCVLIVVEASSIDGTPLPWGPPFMAWMNPVQRGVGFSMMMFNLHLWFIAPFLVVTALMPVVTKLPKLRFVHPVLWMLLLAGLVFVIDAVPGAVMNPVQTSLFYLAWSVLGFALAKRAQPLGRWNLVATLGLGLFIILALPHGMLNMQTNKTPPNWVFAIFTSCWVAVLLLLLPKVDRAWANRLASRVWLKPYIQSGYSIYLWQGLGYSIAVWVGKKEGLPTLVIWVGAIILSTVLGMLASPLERVRFRLG